MIYREYNTEVLPQETTGEEILTCGTNLNAHTATGLQPSELRLVNGDFPHRVHTHTRTQPTA